MGHHHERNIEEISIIADEGRKYAVEPGAIRLVGLNVKLRVGKIS